MPRICQNRFRSPILQIRNKIFISFYGHSNKILDQYKSEYPFFAKLKLSKTGNNEKNLTETLPPFLQFTTYLIEKFISEGKRRIGIVLPGEEMVIDIVKDGKESSQGVAYLDDGTMIVVEGGKKYIGSTKTVLVTSVLQTAAGRMIFAKPKDN